MASPPHAAVCRLTSTTRLNPHRPANPATRSYPGLSLPAASSVAPLSSVSALPSSALARTSFSLSPPLCPSVTFNSMEAAWRRYHRLRAALERLDEAAARERGRAAGQRGGRATAAGANSSGSGDGGGAVLSTLERLGVERQRVLHALTRAEARAGVLERLVRSLAQVLAPVCTLHLDVFPRAHCLPARVISHQLMWPAWPHNGVHPVSSLPVLDMSGWSLGEGCQQGAIAMRERRLLGSASVTRTPSTAALQRPRLPAARGSSKWSAAARGRGQGSEAQQRQQRAQGRRERILGMYLGEVQGLQEEVQRKVALLEEVLLAREGEARRDERFEARPRGSGSAGREAAGQAVGSGERRWSDAVSGAREGGHGDGGEYKGQQSKADGQNGVDQGGWGSSGEEGTGEERVKLQQARQLLVQLQALEKRCGSIVLAPLLPFVHLQCACVLVCASRTYTLSPLSRLHSFTIAVMPLSLLHSHSFPPALSMPFSPLS
ncbi:unnamed protein product [Closterium sp. Naga37s-1]|nr:unnamed protein product [Closterium sp. Naga37s-1]